MASVKSFGVNNVRHLTRCQRPHHFRLRSRRHFSHSPRVLVNPLLNLSHFSAAKEAQFLSKEKKIPREEFHPYLQLIRSSEVDPFAPVPGTDPTVLTALERAKAGKVDPTTTYTLALSNMMAQLELARRETMQVSSAMMVMQQRYRREERSALLFMLIATGLLGFVMLKTRALEDLKGWARGDEVSMIENGTTEKKRIGSPPRIHDEWRQSRYSLSEGLIREPSILSPQKILPSSPTMPAVKRKQQQQMTDSSQVEKKVKPKQKPRAKETVRNSPPKEQESRWAWSSLFWKPKNST